MKHMPALWSMCLLAAVLLLSSACSLANFPYPYTKSTSITLESLPPETAKNALVLIIDYENTGIALENEQVASKNRHLRQQRGRVARVSDSGSRSVRITLPDTVDEQDVYIFAEGYIIQKFKNSRLWFQQNPKIELQLTHDPQWITNFYTQVRPTLYDFLAEDRYRWSQAASAHILLWLNASEKRLYAPSE